MLNMCFKKTKKSHNFLYYTCAIKKTKKFYVTTKGVKF